VKKIINFLTFQTSVTWTLIASYTQYTVSTTVNISGSYTGAEPDTSPAIYQVSADCSASSITVNLLLPLTTANCNQQTLLYACHSSYV